MNLDSFSTGTTLQHMETPKNEQAIKAVAYRDAINLTRSQLVSTTPLLDPNDPLITEIDGLIETFDILHQKYQKGIAHYLSALESVPIQDKCISVTRKLEARGEPFIDIAAQVTRYWGKVDPSCIEEAKRIERRNSSSSDLNLLDKPITSLEADIESKPTTERLAQLETQVRGISEAISAESLKELKAEAETNIELSKNYIADAKVASIATRAAADKAIKEIKDSNSEAYQYTVAREYIESADDEEGHANKYRLLSVISLSTAIALVFSALFLLSDTQTITRTSSEPTVTTVIQEVSYTFDPVKGYLLGSLTLLLTILSAYLARESAKHRIQMNAYRQIAMNTSVVKNITGSLDKDTEAEIVSNLAKYLFSNPVGVGLTAPNDGPPINVAELITKLVEKINPPDKP
ncbi:hypothetical protein [Neptuniibacter sp.]|uniref:hypothetical protein n=1 Tax=Neptuniibacter sp. TaxID=1962643 RepID=UPI0026329571|nr:hypothetical protein [Neptuniibacter sp.]MCP4595739.1 hypothetical protein [Neptuniibacter sp.]